MAFAPDFVDARAINRFGKWSLSEERDSIILVPSDEHILLGCADFGMVYSIAVPVTDNSSVVWDPTRKASYFHFTAWADAGKPVDFELLVDDGAVTAIALA